MIIAQKKPPWLNKRLSTTPDLLRVDKIIEDGELNTVCKSARCPNRLECFNAGTATFLIMGDNCTRRCRYCAIQKGTVLALDENEPQKVANAVKNLGLKHVVITSVTRDDLEDGGIGHFSDTVAEIKQTTPNVTIEVLTPDFKGVKGAPAGVAKMQIDVFNHNIETVPRLYDTIRPSANFNRSLKLLKEVGEYGIITKSSIMLGLGEREVEIVESMEALLANGVKILCLTQYLQPTMENIAVVEYINPKGFDKLKVVGLKMGFKSVISGPYVRSSYKAEIAYSSITK